MDFRRTTGYSRSKRGRGATLILRQLNRRVGAISDELQRQIQALSLEQVEALGEALLDFVVIADLETWLQAHATS
ncbi:DUF4351 domain-containing protein [Nostoc sp. FACHB-280]|uniref:DUF4351 domain-containing protein n=1 Tax=Nostoc sp. FACHB-280 TaxID=2692839 RepID=UPI00168B97DA|nr:DUF4351 domain-containing protein [Nostoc sp. FACHB-280]MBD2494112.1 DUF4351 domain-containing protein [Nostoc sp. FACHB-280]